MWKSIMRHRVQSTQNNQVGSMAQDGCDIICVNLSGRTDPTTVIDLAEKK